MKKIVLLISLVGLAAAKPTPDAAYYAYAPVYGYYTNPLALSANQFHAQDEVGQYNYGYSNQDSAKSEVKTADGVVRGSYSYVDANGVIQTTNYISDALGFRVAATNLPVAPIAEAVAVAAEAPVAEAVAVEAKAEPVVVEAAPEPAAVEVKAEVPVEVPVQAPVQVPVQVPYVAAVPAQQSVIVPHVQYSYLPYATSYPYYAAHQAYAPIAVAAAPVQQVYTQLVDAAVPVVEQPKEATPEETAVAVEPEAVPATQEIITVPILTQYHSQDEQGLYKFGYSEASASRDEQKTAEGVIGHYNYIDSNGQLQTVNYVADDGGFRVTGALPVQVEDTPEVVAAREEHLKLVAETIANQPPEEVVAEVAPVVQQYVAQPEVVAPEVAVPQVVPQQVVYAAAAPVVQQVVAQPQAYYAVAAPAAQQVVVSQPQTYVAVDPQQYVVNQPVVAQPYLVGQPVAVSEPVAPSANQFHAQDEIGQYQYGYANEHSIKTEHKTADGVVRGSYSYVDANGVVQRVDYISDALGFRVAATNLPVHQQPIGIVGHETPALEPVVAEDATEDAPVLPVTEAAPEVVPEVPAGYSVDLRTGLEDIETVEAVPATVVAAKEEQVVVPVQQQVVQVAAAAPYAGHYIVPGYAANYAPVYQPYAASYGYYYNPAYVATSGSLTHSQYHAQDEIGQYNYGYATADSSKSEFKTADGIVHGSYSYVDANGVLQTTNYVSDDWGFRVAATNLPVAVAAPEPTA